MVKITCSILTYNEEKRIRTALAHARQWADEVLVLDKSSTDSTRTLAETAGARVIDIGFSNQGEENPAELIQLASHDWIWGFTPGEVPTRSLVEKAKTLLSTPNAHNIDIVRVPIRFLTFGKVHPVLGQPWALGNQGRIFNKKTAKFRHLVHAHYIPTRDTVSIPFDEVTYVLHPTHIDAKKFIEATRSYVFAEVKQREDHKQRAIEAMALADQFDDIWTRLGDEGLEEKAAWKTYHYMLALACLNTGNEEKANKLYAELRDHLVATDWS
jgi:glycosyltransferase involved in cell wall biosynthesis